MPLLGVEAGDVAKAGENPPSSADSRLLGEDRTAGDDATRETDPLDFRLCIGDERADVLMRFLTLGGGAMAMVSRRRLTTEISAVLSWSVDARETLLRRERGLRPAGSENLSAARLARRCSLGDKLGREAVSGMLEGGGLSAGCLSGDDRKLKIAFMVTEAREDTGQETQKN